MKDRELDLENIVKGKSFCILPWMHLHVLPDSTVIPCCVSPYDDTYGDGSKQTLKEIWNSDKFKQIRLDMIENKRVAGCDHCYQLEDSNFRSMRQSNNANFAKHLPLVLKTEEDGTLNEYKFKYLDIRFSNLCNFKCRGCGPTLSSSWYEDHQALYDYKSDQAKVKSISVESPDFWREIKSLIPDVEVIYFGGGEPLITKEHFEVLRLLESMGKYDVMLSYNTNLSQLNYGAVDLDQIWAKFRRVSLGISLDGIGEKAEYFRHGTKWEVIEKNIKKIVDNYTHVKCYVNCTVNIMNVLYLPEIFNYLLEKKIIEPNGFNINLLLDPVELRIQVLPPFLKKKVLVKLLFFKKDLVARGEEFYKAASDITRILKFLEEEDMSNHIPLFQKNTLKLDSLRSEDFLKTFPELAQLLDPVN